jgi:hypothetical protein
MRNEYHVQLSRFLYTHCFYTFNNEIATKVESLRLLVPNSSNLVIFYG